MIELKLGARWALQRLLHPRMAWVVGLVSAMLAAGTAIEQRVTPSQASDFALTGVGFGLLFPLTVAGLVRRLFPTRPEQQLFALARHGANRLRLGAGATAVLLLSSALCGIWFALVVCAITSAEPADWATSSWIGALAGVTYGSCWLLGSTWGSRAEGLWIALGLDWILGLSRGLLGLFWPRGHIRNLLGGAPVLEMDQNHAILALLLLTGAALGLASRRVPA